MEFSSILPGVEVRYYPPSPSGEYSENFWKAEQNKYELRVPSIGKFLAYEGKYVDYRTDTDADPEWVNLYLKTHISVALLHQRKILNFHASSFLHQGKGVMICGETGAGKSSLTVSFSLSGSEFVTDDLTPVIFKDGQPFIHPLDRDIKLRDNTVEQLKIDTNRLREAEAGTGKLYLKMNRPDLTDFPLNVILCIIIGGVKEPEFIEPEPHEKFSILRGEICMGEMLSFMPETEEAYFGQLLDLINKVPVIKAVRPEEISIREFHSAIEGCLGKRAFNVA